MRSFLYNCFIILYFFVSKQVSAQIEDPYKENLPEILDSIPLKTYWSASQNMPYENALTEFNSGNFEKAIKYYNSILKSNSAEPIAIYNRGICYYKMRDKKLSCSDFKFSTYLQNPNALKNLKSYCDPNINIDSLYNSGFICPDNAQSFDDFNASFDSKPQFPGGNDSLYTYIIHVLKSGRYKDFNFDKNQIRLILFTIDKDGSVQNQISLDQRDKINFESFPKWKPAIKNGQPVKCDYIFPVINGRVFIKEGNKYYNNGVDLLNAGKLTESVSSFNIALFFNQNDFDAYYNRGIGFYKMKDLTSACLDWGNAYLLNSDKQSEDLINKYCDSTIQNNGEKIKIASLKKSEHEKVFTVVEQMPQFPGGEEQLFEFLRRNVKYPIDARENGITGKVYVTFVVDKDGNIKDAKVLRGIAGCEEAALNVVRSMPQWIPGKQDGKNVSVQYNLPIYFSIWH